LARSPFALLTTQSRADLAEQARSDPLARGVVYTLGVAALVALVLAIVGLWTTVVGDVRDERDALFDLEAQGAGPETLRRHLRLRALGLIVFGVVGGCVLGVVLSRLVVSLVKETAAATEPTLPLVTDLGTGTLAIALAALVVGALAAVEATVRQAFRADVPERASWSSE
jgi:ABC-type antimicrobial peptide transport system permease subunit